MLVSHLPQKNLDPILPYSIQKALVALEFGEADHSILDYLQFLSSKINIQYFSFIHMFPDAGIYTGIGQKDAMAPQHKELFLSGLRDIIEDMVIRRFPRKRSFDVDILEGKPLEVLIEKAQTTNPDLIIIGQKSGQKFHGILAKNLVRQLKGSALIIPEKSTHRLKNILVPIDFSKSSGLALRRAMSINKNLVSPAKIHVLYIATIPNDDLLKNTQITENRKVIITNNIKIAFLVFKKRYAIDTDQNIHLNIQFQTAPETSLMIQNYAQQNNIDFIAMGAKGFTNNQNISLGSVSERVLDFNLPIPTFLIK